MTLRMGDAVTVSNLPAGLDAVAGYVDGLYQTYPHLPPAPHKLSIAVSAAHDADCLDVESGDATNAEVGPWIRRQEARGSTLIVVYTSLSNLQTLTNLLASTGIGRSSYKVWSAHYTNVAHICSAVCGLGFTGTADGTQWTDHNGSWDESLLLDSFFPQPDPYKELDMASMVVANDQAGDLIIVGNAKDNGDLLMFKMSGGVWDVIDVTDAATATAHHNNPADTRLYQLAP